MLATFVTVLMWMFLSELAVMGLALVAALFEVDLNYEVLGGFACLTCFTGVILAIAGSCL